MPTSNYMYVECSCGNHHYGDNLETLNIEENFEGRDVLTFKCPVTGYTEKSLVYIGYNTYENNEYWTDDMKDD